MSGGFWAILEGSRRPWDYSIFSSWLVFLSLSKRGKDISNLVLALPTSGILKANVGCFLGYLLGL